MKKKATAAEPETMEEAAAQLFQSFTQPPKEKLEDWKVRYPNADFLGVVIAGEFYVYRTLGRDEYLAFQQSIPEGVTTQAVEQKLVELSVFWPEDYRGDKIGIGKAGISETLIELIMMNSGFQPQSPSIKL